MKPFIKIGALLGVFLGSFLFVQAATCVGAFFGGTGFCYATGSTGGIQTGAVPFGTGTSGLATSSNLYWDNTNSRLSIGTTTPNWPFEVAGTRPVIALSDFSDGANLKHWLVSSQAGFLYFSSSTDQYATSTFPNLTLSNTNGRTGIDIAIPNAILDVAGTGASSDFRVSRQNNTSTYLAISAPGGSNTASNFYVNGTNSMSITSTGLVGIGTTTPVTKLDVNGSAQFEGAASTLSLNPYGAVGNTNTFSFTNGRTVIGYDGGLGGPVFKDDGTGRAIHFLTGGTERLTIGATGNVGIGTTTPISGLSVVSNTTFPLYVSTTTGGTLFAIDNVGNKLSSGDAPTCGTGCSTVAGDNNGGQITTSALATAVTMNFADGGFPAGGTMWCNVNDNSTSISFDVSSLSNTSVTFSAATGLTGTLYYSCGEHISR